MIAICPHCGAAHDVAARFTGDTVFCRHCAGWFTIWFRTNGIETLKAAPPVTWPKETRRARE